MSRFYDVDKLADLINDMSDDWSAEANGQGLTIFNNNVEEDYFIEIYDCPTFRELTDEIQSICDNFDPDEHAEEWVQYRREGATSGIPGIRQLLEEADEIDSNLSDLAYIKLSDIIDKYEELYGVTDVSDWGISEVVDYIADNFEEITGVPFNSIYHLAVDENDESSIYDDDVISDTSDKIDAFLIDHTDWNQSQINDFWEYFSDYCDRAYPY